MRCAGEEVSGWECGSEGCVYVLVYCACDRAGMVLCSCPDHFRSEWYDPEAFLLNEEGVVMGGLLMGLNVIDYNVIMKGEDYDRPVSIGGLMQVDGAECRVSVCAQGSLVYVLQTATVASHIFPSPLSTPSIFSSVPSLSHI